jgi:hypothetical protein
MWTNSYMWGKPNKAYVLNYISPKTMLYFKVARNLKTYKYVTNFHRNAENWKYQTLIQTKHA